MLLARNVRSLSLGLLIVGALTITPHTWAADEAPADRQRAALADDEAALSLRKALQAETAGKPEERAAHLQAALKASPDFAPAHWHSGEVKWSDRWLTPENLAKEVRTSDTFNRYTKLRDQAQETYNDQMTLADWCMKNGLEDQERAHLLMALILAPNSKDAMARLGFVRLRGQLVPREQAAAFNARAKQWDASVAQWKGRLHRLLSKTQGDQSEAALNEIRAIRDPAAIPGMESVFGKSKPYVALAVVAALAEMPQQAATESLVRHALFSPYREVRDAAASGLRGRDIYSYAPLLLAAAASPIETGLETYTDARGTVAYRLNLLREGVFENVAFSQTEVRAPEARTVIKGETHLIPVRTDQPQALASPPAILAQVSKVNAQATELNERVASALTKATDEAKQSTADEKSAAEEESDSDEPSADPIKLWNWWYDHNGYFRPDRPSTSTYAVGNYPAYSYRAVTYRAPPSPGTSRPNPPVTFTVGRGSECFPAGTTVWTFAGPVQIEKVQIGDCALSQDPETGRLAYKPVLATTSRPPSPLIEVRAGNSVIRSTRGHPYWVSGIGWQMAKELKAGQWLHTAKGPVLIDSAEPSYEDVCYNLVVADFNTFFVGDAQVLVHDNNLRGPNTFTVPGLAKE